MKRKVLYLAPLVLGSLLVSLWAYQSMVSAREVEIPAGTKLRIRLDQTLDTSRNRRGDSFAAKLDTPLMLEEKVVLPQGTPVQGHITAAKPSGRLKGRGFMTLTLDSLHPNDQSYQVVSNSQSRATGSHKKRNLMFIGGGSGFGTLVGALAGGAKGALIGGGVGAAAGAATAVLTGKKHVYLPAETVLTFSLKEPVRIGGKSPATT
ncbi:MAG: hypothetical protein A3F68_08560 [Acidobacteria bacterium RIFCSPLOWO2_12_FULL_54_10]|nr:MAG: hypothetical protein A3F68_08560 [Acidobacteria bacterium RIFCSPLOWO2_12_FULL_54_10]